MPDHTTTIHKDGRTISIVTDEDGDRTVTTTGDDHSNGAATVTAASGDDHGDGAATATTALTRGTQHGFTVGINSDKPFDDASFAFGIIVGALLLYIVQRWRRRRRTAQLPAQVADVSQHDVAALARRTANLERIITDPATRTASEIDALR